MGQLIYIANTSLDGFIEDDTGSIDWTEPNDEVHAFINDLVRPVGTHLYGRRMWIRRHQRRGTRRPRSELSSTASNR